MNTCAKYLFISPHLDDAILCCGGNIYALTNEKSEVLILTIFAGKPDPGALSHIAKYFHRACGLGDDAINSRRREDMAAATYLGAEVCHLDSLSCLYRKSKDGKPVYEKLRDIYHLDTRKEAATLIEVKKIILTSVDLGIFNEIYVPLGIGNHADHLITRKSLEDMAVSRRKRISSKLVYYEDIPYACRSKNIGIENSTLGSFTSYLKYIERKAWSSKIRAISLYKSQVHVIWKNVDTMEVQLTNYSHSIAGGRFAERYWKKRA